MGDFWNILIPVVVIGAIFLNTISENKKKTARQVAPKAVQQPATPRESVKPAFIEGERAIKPKPEPAPKKAKKNPDVHNAETSEATGNTDVAGAVSDLRRAIIAHEILKRKF